MIDVTYLKSKD